MWQSQEFWTRISKLTLCAGRGAVPGVEVDSRGIFVSLWRISYIRITTKCLDSCEVERPFGKILPDKTFINGKFRAARCGISAPGILWRGNMIVSPENGWQGTAAPWGSAANKECQVDQEEDLTKKKNLVYLNI